MMNRRLLLAVLTLVILIATTMAVTLYAQGYRPNLTKKTVDTTGMLVASSDPQGAQVFLNERLTTATNNTLNLPPGEYQVRIAKDGFIPWEKKLKIEKGVVIQTQAFLFPQAPDFRALTSTGAISPTLSPDGSKIAYGVATASAQKTGVWILDLSDRPLSFQSQSRQIANSLTLAQFRWSPDSKQVLASQSGTSYLLDADRLNDAPKNITSTLPLLLSNWDTDTKTNQDNRESSLKPTLLKILRDNAKIISFSPDESKILYTATQSATIPQIIKPPLPGADTQPEEREIKPQKIYIYDTKEDKNFYIASLPEPAKTEKPKTKQTVISPIPQPPSSLNLAPEISILQWFPTSRHLIYVEPDKISLMEYDGTNRHVVYAGPFENNYVFPTPNGSKIIILTTYNRAAGIAPNLYTINLR